MIIRNIVQTIFERVPVLNKLNGYKTKIGASLICFYYIWKAVYPVLASYFPEILPTLGSLDILMGQYIQFVADILVVFGVQHQIIKNKVATENYEHQQYLYS